jgi:hypothetical protein
VKTFKIERNIKEDPESRFESPEIHTENKNVSLKTISQRMKEGKAPVQTRSENYEVKPQHRTRKYLPPVEHSEK